MKLKTLIVLSLGAMLFTSCGSCSNQSKDKVETIAQTKSMGIEELLVDFENQVGKTISLEGVCSHVCGSGGKLFIEGSLGERSLRVNATDVSGNFGSDLEKSSLVITGKVVEERIDEAYLQEMEANAKNQEKPAEEGDDHSCSDEISGLEETMEAIANYRKEIAERNEKEGKNYLSIYTLSAEKCEVK